MNKEKRTEIFTRLRDANPHPETELEYTTPYELLVAVTLSAQATDVSVNKATQKLFPVANTPEKMVALGRSGIRVCAMITENNKNPASARLSGAGFLSICGYCVMRCLLFLILTGPLRLFLVVILRLGQVLRLCS